MPIPLIWLVVALGLAGAEALTGDLSLLMLSGGAFAAVGSSLLFDELWIDAVAFAVVSVQLLVLVRPMIRRRFAAGTSRLLEPAKALEGKSALVLDTVERHAGQVKLDGEVWTARPLNDDDVYEPGDHVTVMHIDGATAVVFKTV
jgi:membrane protein implicated in regulation of membrane protease activity